MLADMGAIHDLMKRLGFVRLDRYGLILTADDRVLTTRQVIDDGMGNRIVGWRDDDFPAMQLQGFDLPRVAAPVSFPQRPLAPPVPAARPPMPVPPPVAMRALPGVSPAKSPVIPVAPPVIAPAPASVAPEPVVEEDEWEWEIAMARARAAAAEAEQPAVKMTRMEPPVTRRGAGVRTPPPLPPQVTPVTTRVPPELMTKMAEVAQKWPEAETWTDDEPEVVATRPVVKAPVRHRAGSEPATVIPVPHLPKVATASSYKPMPVVRGNTQPLRRVVRGTGSEDTVRTMAAPANDDRTSPSIGIGELTSPGIGIGDRTSPGFAMPPSKRVAAKQR